MRKELTAEEECKLKSSDELREILAQKNYWQPSFLGAAREELYRRQVSPYKSNQPLPNASDELFSSGFPKWEIQLQDGTVRKVFAASELFPEILSGKISGDLPCRLISAASKNGTTKITKWSSVADTVGKSGFEARLLFKLVWGHSLHGLLYGVILGFVLWLAMNIFNSLSAAIELHWIGNAKAQYFSVKLTAYGIICGWWLAQAIPMVGEVIPWTWIKNLGGFVAPRAFKSAVICLFLVGMNNDVSAVFAGVFPGLSAAFGAMIAGTLVCGPPGMIIGTVIGMARRPKLQTAPGWRHEALHILLLKGVLLPLSISVAVVFIWIHYGETFAEDVVKGFLR